MATSGIKRFSFLWIFTIIPVVLFSEETKKAYAPPDIHREITVMDKRFDGNPPGKKTIIIDDESLKHYSPRKDDPISTGSKSCWWEGFEHSLVPEDIFKSLLDRMEKRAPETLALSHLSALFREKKHGELYEELKKNISSLHSHVSQNGEKETLSDLYCCLGILHFDLMNFSDAEKQFLCAIQRDPDNLAARLLLCSAFVEQGRFDAAKMESAPLRASSYYPVLLHSVLSRIYQNESRLSRALYHWKKVVHETGTTKRNLSRLHFLESEVHIQQNFSSYSTAHYEVSYEPVFEKNRERILSPLLSMVDQARWSLNRRFKASPRDTTKIVIYREESFHSLLGNNDPNTEAFFSFDDGKLRIALRGEETTDISNLRPVIFHEYVHRIVFYLTRGRMRRRWLHEGLACYYERSETGVDRFSQETLPSEPANLDDLLEEKIDLQGYVQARNIVEILINRFGEKRMIGFLRDIGEGKSFENAMQTAWGVSYEELKVMAERKFR